MLNIFYGRENLNKSRFVYENIQGKTLVVVPNQFTLEAERDAFYYLQKKVLMDIDIISFGRMGGNVIAKTGGKPSLIGREGRQMLLSKILKDEEKNLEVFSGSAKKLEFVQLIHDLISDMKQHNVRPEYLNEVVGKLNEDSLIFKKLKEVHRIFQSYEDAIYGKYLDNEDYIELYLNKIKDADFIKESSIWIYGFDTFTEKNLSVIRELEKYARNVNVVVTYSSGQRDDDLFKIGKIVIRKLKELCEDVKVISIGEEYIDEKSTQMEILERELFAETCCPSDITENIKIVRAANSYSEAASAASYILSLVRDEGYRYRDIALISNDIENQGEMYKRVFAEYGINLFLDMKRDVMYHPAVIYIMAIVELISYGYTLENVLKLVKTGFVFDSCQEEEDLELYGRKFKVKGAAWKKDFEKGRSFFSSEQLEELNNSRKKLIEPLEDMEGKFKAADTLGEKLSVLYDFLSQDAGLEEKIQNLVELQESEGNLEGAEETAQIWKVITSLFEQLVEILGEEKISNRELAELLGTGFKSVEIGVIPPSVDGLVAGTMQRTRRGHTKVTVIIGASEGMLPKEMSETGILNDDERVFLNEQEIDICKLGPVRTMEENMAIYKNMSKASDRLYISYASSDSEGKAKEPSTVFQKIREIFPNVKVELDIFSKGDSQSLIGGIESTKDNLFEALGGYIRGEELDPSWIEVYKWYKENTNIDEFLENLIGKFEKEGISEIEAKELFERYEDGFSFSPSRLEKFGTCPFAHFVQYGLRPDENRPYEVGAAESGTVIHQCMMEVSKELTEPCQKQNIDVTDDHSPWMTVTEEEIEQKVDDVLSRISEEYLEGILSQGELEKYRAQRLKNLCKRTVWTAVSHVRKGRIKDMFFESNFGQNGQFPPLEVPSKTGRAFVEGQIDRVDILEGEYSKVIDYKSGQSGLKMDEVYAGRKLQLFIYLMATAEKEGLKPGGAFYFPVDEIIDESTKMDGFVCEEDRVVIGIDSEEKVTKRIYKSGKERILSKSDFELTMEKVRNKVDSMAFEITSGEIGAKPKNINKVSSCTYCKFKGICKFDLSIDECKYNMI